MTKMKTPTIPLFPLPLVVFPESKYPLHIFEERYKRMINRCIAGNEGFGIVAQIGTELSKIGSYVKVISILKKYANGESDIVVQGLYRFVIQEYHTHPDGYFEALVDNYNDISDVIIKESLLEDLRKKFQEIINKVNFVLEDSYWKNYSRSLKKSFKIAEKSGLSLEQQQTLLSLRDENKRIHFLIDHLKNLEKQIEKGIALREVIFGDGYINN